MDFPSTPAFDPAQPVSTAPLAIPVEPPPIMAPPPAPIAGPIAASSAGVVWTRKSRQRVSVFRRGWNYLREAFRRSRHDAPRRSHEPPASLTERLVTSAPPWFVSMIVHLSLMLLLGLIAVKVHQDVVEEMTVAMAPDENLADQTFAETLGEQLETPAPGVAPDDVKSGTDPTYAISDLPEVANPLAAPPKMDDLMANGAGLYSEIEALSIGNALKGREAGRKQQLLDSYGGTMTTQHSVDLALAWLTRQQGRDGLWSLEGPYPDGGTAENKTAATAMALLAFLGDGHTHLKNGPHRQTVGRGLRGLLKLQGAEGDFVKDVGPAYHRMYTHAQCTIVLCELYGMTQDSEIRDAAERAVDYCVKSQAPAGGWRYFPQQEGDVSVTGWFVMALQSARMANLKVPSETFVRIGGFLDSASNHGGSRYAYQPGRQDSPAMTAEALLCRQYLGWKHDNSKLVKGVAFVGNHPVEWDGERNVYYWYYATQVMHHMGGKPWVEWNRVMRQVVPEHQIGTGKQHGSWDPGDSQWSRSAGRLFVTCLSTYMLEVYYRHLPLYARDSLADDSPADSSPVQ